MNRLVQEELVTSLKTPAVYVAENVFLMNAAACALTGFSPGEIQAKSEWFEILYEDDAKHVFHFYEKSKNDQFATSYDSVIKTKSGVVKHIRSTGYLGTESEIWFVSDMTTQMNIQTEHEYEIKSLNTAMSEIRRLQKKLKLENNKLKKSNKELEDFAYVASHDLKEPVRKITNFASRLIAKHSDQLDETALLYLERMDLASRRMLQLIDDLLKYSRVSRQTIKKEEIDMRVLLDNIVDQLSRVISESKAEIEFGDLKNLHGNPSLISSLFLNLINNGIKFHKPNVLPKIKISSKLVKVRTRSYVQYIISDNGIGIEEKYQSKIFKIFERLHNKDKYKGTGIGLAIVKRIVEKHNGTIKVTSKLGNGTSFIINIPQYKSKKTKAKHR